MYCDDRLGTYNLDSLISWEHTTFNSSWDHTTIFSLGSNNHIPFMFRMCCVDDLKIIIL